MLGAPLPKQLSFATEEAPAVWAPQKTISLKKVLQDTGYFPRINRKTQYFTTGLKFSSFTAMGLNTSATVRIRSSIKIQTCTSGEAGMC